MWFRLQLELECQLCFELGGQNPQSGHRQTDSQLALPAVAYRLLPAAEQSCEHSERLSQCAAPSCAP